MDPSKTLFNALIVGLTNSGKMQYLVNQLRRPFRGQFDYILLLCPTLMHNRTFNRFLDEPLHLCYRLPANQGQSWLYLFCQHEHAHSSRRLYCLQRRQRPHDPAGLLRLQYMAHEHQHVGAYPADHQHCKALLRERGSHHALFCHLKQDNQDHL